MSASIETIKSNKTPIYVDVFVDNGDPEIMMEQWSQSDYLADWANYAHALGEKMAVKFENDPILAPRIVIKGVARAIDNLPKDFDTICAETDFDRAKYYYDFTSHPLNEAR